MITTKVISEFVDKISGSGYRIGDAYRGDPERIAFLVGVGYLEPVQLPKKGRKGNVGVSEEGAED